MNTQDVQAHYESTSIIESLREGLIAQGKDIDAIVPRDLSAVDEFHIRGRASTAETAALASFEPGSHVLDVGCGIGGPSRHLAAEFGVRVTGLDLCPSYCSAAQTLATWVGLQERVRYCVGDATRIPFSDASFDGVWTQHASMNIEDKGAFYAEMARVLRAGGTLALYDIHADSGEPLHFPVPWARHPDISFLCTPDHARELLRAAGLTERVWNDDSAQALAWFQGRLEAARQGEPAALGLHLMLGPEWPAMAANIVRNLQERRIRVQQSVWVKP